MQKRAISLRTKISAVIILAVIVVTVIMGTILFIGQLSNLHASERKFLHDSVRSAGTIAFTMAPHLVANDYALMSELVSHYRERSYRAYVAVVNNEGKIVAHSEPGRIGTAFVAPPASRTEKEGEGTIRHFSDHGKEYVDISYPVKAGDLALGTVRLGLNTQWVTENRKSIKTTMYFLLMTTTAILVVAIVLASTIAKKMTGSLKLLAGAAEEVGRGDYSGSVEVTTNDEIGTLARAFDRMLHELRKSWAQLIEKDYLDSVIANIDDILIVADGEGRIEMMNEAGLESLGYRREEIEGRHLRTIVAESGEGQGIFEKAMARGYVGNTEIFFLDKERDKIPVLVSGSVMQVGGKAKGIVFAAKDITERKRYEDALRESEEKYRSVVENVGIGITLISPAMEVLSVNRQMKIWFSGIDSFEWPFCYKVFNNPPAESPCGDCPTVKTLADGQVHEMIREVPIGGRLVNYRVVASPVKDKDGNVVAAIELLEDITERRAAEQALKISEERLSEAQQIAHIGNWEWELATNRVFWSAELYRIYGYEPNEISPDYGLIVNAMHQDSKAAFLAAIESALKGGGPFEMDYAFFKKDGTSAILHTIGRVMCGEDGSPERMIGTVQDITADRQAQQALRESEEKFRNIFDNANDGILVAGMSTGRFVGANKTMCGMLGYERGELLKIGIENIHSTEDLPRIMHAFEDQKSGAKPVAEDIPVLKKDGTVFYADICATPITLAGEPCMVGMFRDITDRKRAGEQIARALREKEILLKEIHHRVKNNLQVVASMLQLQSGYIKDADSRLLFEESQKRVETMSLIHEKLYRSKDLSRIDFREYVESLAANLLILQTGVAERLKLRIDIEGIELDVNRSIPCGLILNELITNSLRHAFPEGREGEIAVAMSRQGDSIALTVSDDGIGFPPEIDFRHTKTLGMQLVISLARQLGGSILLDSGEGTSFRIEFR